MPQPFGMPHSESRTSSSTPFVSFPFGLVGGVDYVDDHHGIGGRIDEIVEDMPHDRPGVDALCLEFANEISADNSRPSPSARSRDRFSRGNPWLSSPVGPDRLAPHVSTLGRVHQEVIALGTHDDDGGLAILHGSGHHRRSGWTSVQRTGRCSRGSWPLSRRRNGTDDDRANRSGT